MKEEVIKHEKTAGCGRVWDMYLMLFYLISLSDVTYVPSLGGY